MRELYLLPGIAEGLFKQAADIQSAVRAARGQEDLRDVLRRDPQYYVDHMFQVLRSILSSELADTDKLTAVARFLHELQRQTRNDPELHEKVERNLMPGQKLYNDIGNLIEGVKDDIVKLEPKSLQLLTRIRPDKILQVLPDDGRSRELVFNTLNYILGRAGEQQDVNTIKNVMGAIGQAVQSGKLGANIVSAWVADNDIIDRLGHYGARGMLALLGTAGEKAADILNTMDATTRNKAIEYTRGLLQNKEAKLGEDEQRAIGNLMLANPEAGASLVEDIRARGGDIAQNIWSQVGTTLAKADDTTQYRPLVSQLTDEELGVIRSKGVDDSTLYEAGASPKTQIGAQARRNAVVDAIIKGQQDALPQHLRDKIKVDDPNTWPADVIAGVYQRISDPAARTNLAKGDPNVSSRLNRLAAQTGERLSEVYAVNENARKTIDAVFGGSFLTAQNLRRLSANALARLHGVNPELVKQELMRRYSYVQQRIKSLQEGGQIEQFKKRLQTLRTTMEQIGIRNPALYRALGQYGTALAQVSRELGEYVPKGATRPKGWTAEDVFRRMEQLQQRIISTQDENERRRLLSIYQAAQPAVQSALEGLPEDQRRAYQQRAEALTGFGEQTLAQRRMEQMLSQAKVMRARANGQYYIQVKLPGSTAPIIIRGGPSAGTNYQQWFRQQLQKQLQQRFNAANWGSYWSKGWAKFWKKLPTLSKQWSEALNPFERRPHSPTFLQTGQ